MITVLKFGGTSVGSTEALKRVANIIIAEKDDKVAVVSAMSGITNFLVSALEDKNVDLEDVFFKFEERHMNVAKELFDEEHLALFTKEFNERLDEFKTLVADKENWSDPFFKDNVSSQGERFSSLMLAHLISSMGHKSVALTAETAGVYAVGNPLSGSCDLKKTSIGMGMNVKPILENDIIPIITGFYGINEDGKPLTFGRGGSDYAASAIGNALDADVIEIWTDVDGFMSADPRLVPDAVVIEEMNYSEAGELAYFGAKVLHPRTIEPARMKHIPVKIKNSYRPENPGTLIHNFRKKRDELLKSVAMKADLSIITIRSGEIAYRPKLMAKAMEKIGEVDTVYGLSTSLSTMAFLVHNNDVPLALSGLRGIDFEDLEGIDIKSGVTLICAVGDDLLDRNGFSGEVFGAIKDIGANIEMISEGASDVSLNFVVPTESAADVIKVLHSRFISGGQ
ncbi:MAG: aspartate kinase [Candidatus Methanomethylophilaceae archaeon]|nr:aspartate kinase [Candidatus Methanomethylophilaceae archaeon]